MIWTPKMNGDGTGSFPDVRAGEPIKVTALKSSLNGQRRIQGRAVATIFAADGRATEVFLEELRREPIRYTTEREALDARDAARAATNAARAAANDFYRVACDADLAANDFARETRSEMSKALSDHTFRSDDSFGTNCDVCGWEFSLH